MPVDLLPDPISFDWDEGNSKKNWFKHKVTIEEAEEVFFNNPRVTAKDKKHSTEKETRYGMYGQTDKQRLLFIVFTMRNQVVRIISARDQNKKERRLYEKATQS